MIDRVLADMKDSGFSEVVLWVFADNTRAGRFYEAKGFCATEHLKQYFSKLFHFMVDDLRQRGFAKMPM